jgi:serine/threonine-protein kinase PpkA
VKSMRPEMSAPPEREEALYREASVWQGLLHPNIVRLESCYKREGVMYLVLEYMPGGSLRDRISRGVTLHETPR